MRQTGLDGLIDVLYSSPDHDFPAGETRESVRTLSPENYGLKVTVHRNVPRSISKPNPRILREIIAEQGVDVGSTVYVGDNLDRDIEMAQRLGVIDVHAQYGQTFGRAEYDLLRAVTHWSSEEVEKERSTDSNVKASPSYVLGEGFYQLLDYFDFGPPFDTSAHIDLWKEAVGVQMHFNDIGWRIRGLALTVLTFTLGAIGFVYVNTDPVRFLAAEISPAFILPLLGMVLWTSFWFADRGWFHKLLIGAVREGADLENLLVSKGIQVNLGGRITDASPIRFYKKQSREDRNAGAARTPRTFRGRPVEWHSSRKLNIFYMIGFALLGATAIVLLLLAPQGPLSTESVPPVVNNHITVVPPLAPPEPETTAPAP